MEGSQRKSCNRPAKRGSRGVTLIFVAFGMVLLLGIAGMVIDLSYLYCARGDAQRAADSAALAAARDFADSGYTTGLITTAQVETLAASDAAKVGNENPIVGQSPDINSTGFSSTCPPPPGSDGCFDTTVSNDPRVTVVVQRTKARGNPMPLFFMNMFGVSTADVSAEATAEAYTPSQGNNPPIDIQSIKPWLVPNCDQNPNHVVPAGDPRANPNCPASGGGFDSYYIYPPGSANASQVVYPGQYPSGDVGELIDLKPGSPSAAPAPSQFYPLYFPYTNQASCPACAAATSSSSGPGSASLYEDNIQCETPWLFTCGPTQIQLASGNMVGPTETGVNCLIHEINGYGQDTLSLSQTPFSIISGSMNPYFPEGETISTSDSIVAVPLYDGSNLCPGGSCGATVTIQGFLQLFIQEEGPPQGTVAAYVLNIGGCGNQSSSATPLNPTSPSNPIVVRLIHN